MNVYRLDKTGRLTVVADDINRPDGLAFSARQQDALHRRGRIEPAHHPGFSTWSMTARGLRAGVFIRIDKGQSDGLRVDVDGNSWCAWAGATA